MNVCQTSIVLEAWRRGQELAVHGWIYGLQDGLLRDLGATIMAPEEVAPGSQAAIAKLDWSERRKSAARVPSVP